MKAINITSHVHFLRALRSKPFALLWAGQTISILGNGAFSTALAWEVLLLTGSATAMGIVVLAQTLPMFLFLLIGGVAADTLPRRILMLWSDILRGGIVTLIAVLGWARLLQLWHLVALALCFGFVKCFFDPAYQAIRAQLVDTEALASANALTKLSWQIGSLVGPLLGVSCVAVGGPASAFAFDGITFFISAFCLFSLSIHAVSSFQIPHSTDSLESSRESSNNVSSTFSARQSTQSVIKNIIEGVQYVASSRWLWISILIASVGNIGFAASLSVALPKLIHDVYGEGVWLLGVLATTNAIGSLFATVVVAQLRRLRRRGLLAYGSLFIYSLALMAFGFPFFYPYHIVTSLVANALIGFGLAAFDIIWITVMQELVPNNVLGRVSSIDTFASFIFLPVGYVLGGMLSDRLGPAWVFLASGGLNFIGVLIGLCLRDIRQME